MLITLNSKYTEKRINTVSNRKLGDLTSKSFMGGLGFKDFFQWGKQASQKEYLHLLQMLWILYCMYLYIDAKMGEHFAWPIITPDDRCCPQLSTLLSSVLSLLSEYPLPLFVPDSLPHYWSCIGCHRRINSQPRCGYKSITTAPFVVSTQSCNGISDNQELLQL